MQDVLSAIISVLWIAWLIYWYVSSRHVKATRWRASSGLRALYRVPGLLAGAFLVGSPRWLPQVLHENVFPATLAIVAAGTIAVALGLGFAVWARRHLGGNWSSDVALKDNHALVRTGPYRYVRHPIYTGILLALCGSAMSINQWRAIVGVGFALLGFLFKLRLEEEQMRALFPEYDDYRKHTSAIVPFVL